MASTEFRLCDVTPDSWLNSRDARIEREQALANIDLLESNTFTPIGHDGGPYRLRIETAEGRLALHVNDQSGRHIVSNYLSLTPFRRLIKNYTRSCESYYVQFVGRDPSVWRRSAWVAVASTTKRPTCLENVCPTKSA
ncbi:hypothetical protein NXT3_PB00289 (plasmid) [Sinorhizobium fredii]|uniref:Uncharacterized protein n=1 Tax=Rhizobium fredii TaxID=380 RepID=A0A2L0HBV5_RHIFR|nr:UPF0262 family protein [Sinorhizobium fredii]AUX78946.1 hypothetical protein NXT3_PB00289 [Sinorhizobium fredii]